MPEVSDKHDAVPLGSFDPTKLAEMDSQMRSVFFEHQLERLPKRAIVAFALRCAKRVEPLVHLQPLIADAYSSGLDVSELAKYAGRLSADHAVAVYIISAYNEGANAVNSGSVAIENGFAAAGLTADVYTSSAATVYADTVADLNKLLGLNLGSPDEPGEPIRWNDPRLGPLWPDGPPEKYVQAERACRELEDQLRNLPTPNAPPDDPLLVAQFEDWAWLDQLRDEGKLDQYRGEYVFAAEKQIFGHGRNLLELRPPAEEEAKAKGIPPERLIDYFMPGE